MKITSLGFSNGQPIPKQYSREGGDKSPPLKIEDVPAQAKSLALIMDDPDAPKGTFTHWILFNMDPHISEIREDAPPVMATQGRNDYGEVAYGGPQPPSGEHRYFFRIYALDSVLTLARGAQRPDIDAAIQGHILDQAEIMGRFAAPKLQPAGAR